MNIKKWLPALGGGVVVLLVLGWFVSVSNDLVSTKQEVDRRWSEVENKMQRRYELTNQTVDALKGQIHHEDKVYIAVADARRQYANAKTPTEKMKADAQLNRSTNMMINVVRENYPELKSSKNFDDLMIQLEGTENRMSYARQEYNDAVRNYNNLVLQFPTSTVAQMKGYHERSYFKADKAVHKAPKIDFDDN